MRKEVWVPADRADTVVIMVWWTSYELWKAISDEQVEAVDREMGEWFREPAVRELPRGQVSSTIPCGAP